jgi:hypothetical protein
LNREHIGDITQAVHDAVTHLPSPDDPKVSSEALGWLAVSEEICALNHRMLFRQTGELPKFLSAVEHFEGARKINLRLKWQMQALKLMVEQAEFLRQGSESAVAQALELLRGHVLNIGEATLSMRFDFWILHVELLYTGLYQHC